VVKKGKEFQEEPDSTGKKRGVKRAHNVRFLFGIARNLRIVEISERRVMACWLGEHFRGVEKCTIFSE